MPVFYDLVIVKEVIEKSSEPDKGALQLQTVHQLQERRPMKRRGFAVNC